MLDAQVTQLSHMLLESFCNVCRAVVSPFDFNRVDRNVLRNLGLLVRIVILQEFCASHQLVIRLDYLLEETELDLHIDVYLRGRICCVELFSHKSENLINEQTCLLLDVIGFSWAAKALLNLFNLLEESRILLHDLRHTLFSAGILENLSHCLSQLPSALLAVLYNIFRDVKVVLVGQYTRQIDCV